MSTTAYRQFHRGIAYALFFTGIGATLFLMILFSLIPDTAHHLLSICMK